MTFNDRTVHAAGPGWELVRYDRAGRWKRVEVATGRERPVTLAQAVELVTSDGTTWFGGRPGGKAFDAKVRQARQK